MPIAGIVRLHIGSGQPGHALAGAAKSLRTGPRGSLLGLSFPFRSLHRRHRIDRARLSQALYFDGTLALAVVEYDFVPENQPRVFNRHQLPVVELLAGID